MNKKIVLAILLGCSWLANSAYAQTATVGGSSWAVTATSFKIEGEKDVNNVKLNWMIFPEADSYKVYRDGKVIGTAKGDTFDDYSLPVGKKFSYYVEAYKAGVKIATAAAQSAATFTPDAHVKVIDNLNGKEEAANSVEKPAGYKIGNRYYKYEMRKEGDKWNMKEYVSKTGLKDSWSTPRLVTSYPSTQKFEGNAFHFNEKTKKVVFSSHYEDEGGYNAAKIFLAQITPGGKIEVGTAERPLGHDSRDQSLFIDEDGTGYLLSATNTNQDINIYKLDPTWTKVVSLVKTLFQGMRRETPAIVKKDGEYYFFTSKASGWYPSQTKYASATNLGGEWTELREIGNNSTFAAQFNRVEKKGTDQPTYGVVSYHWGAQTKYKDPNGNFPRTSALSFNKGFAAMDYYRYIEVSDKYGFIPVQSGRNLTLNKPVTSQVPGANGVKADCVTDGVDFESSPYFARSSNASPTQPYILVVDMQKESQIKELNLATRLVNGSEAAYKYTIEGSKDGQNYVMLVDGRMNWQTGFVISPITDSGTYRYLRLRVYDMRNVHKGNSARWADGILEFTAYGK